ncbi:MAG TPA: hypothetical protein VK698_33735 [Kofleriaceae bacterium]|nr:hypothetical protein [Kofleriaceae bacterium]
MPFRRQAHAVVLPAMENLASAVAGLGIAMAATPLREADIEATLLAASIEGMDRADLRLVALVVSWFGVHSSRVNADRLTRLVAGQSIRVRALWAALALWKRKDRRFGRLARVHRGQAIDLLATGTDFQLRRRGEDLRFSGSGLRVPAGVLRDRPGDIEEPAALARRHRTYHWRVVIGPTYRADLWAALERTPSATAYAVAGVTGASYASAWSARADFLSIHGARRGRPRPGGAISRPNKAAGR